MKKKYFLILILFSFFITNVNASTNTLDRNNLDNYGINKKWEVNEYNINNILSTPAVNSSEKVYDFAGLLTDEDEQKIYELTQNFKDNTGMELIILTINSSYLYDSYNEDIATNFYDYNDFGLDIENYSGVLLLRNSYEKDPYFNLYTFGDAQLYYSLSRTDGILDNIYNDIHNNNYYFGIETLYNDLIKYYNKGKAPEYKYSYINDKGYITEKYHIPWFIVLIISTIGTAIIMSILINKNKMIRKEYKASEYLVKDSVTYSKKEDRFITSHTSSYTTSSSSGGHGGGSHSGSSGGGHSSGSGRHG